MPVLTRALFLALFAAVCGGGAFAAPPTAVSTSAIELTGRAFGTTYSVKVVSSESPIDADELQSKLPELLAEVDAQMSLWRDDSELSRFNEYEKTGWFDVSTETARVVSAAVALSDVTKGAFDPTVGPLVELWGFGPRKHTAQRPTEDEIAQALKRMGASLIDVRLSPPALRKHLPGVQLDLNAIAKGDAVDRVAALLETYEPRGYLVEIGGEVRTGGTKSDGTRWKVGIEQPQAGQRSVRSVVELHNVALATSGDYRNYIETANRQRYSHTIDPRTGRPIDHALASVTVLADDCMTADAWATALMVLGPDHGVDLAEASGIRALFLTRDGERLLSQTTSGFPQIRDVAGRPGDSGESALSTFVLTAVIFGLAIAAMSVGVILSHRRLRGTCGGLSGMKDQQGNPLCDACTHPAAECEEYREKVQTSSTDSVDQGPSTAP